MQCRRGREVEAGEVLGDVPVQTAIISGCALGDVYAGYAECLLWDFHRCIRGRRHAEVAGNKHKFIVGAYTLSVHNNLL